jgi:hypothetical protein
MKRYPIILSFILFGLAVAHAQTGVHYTKQDSLFVVETLSWAKQQKDKACWPLLFADKLLGRPYVSHTLELYPDKEQLIVNTRQLDCTTLVETVTALTLCAQDHLTSFSDYCDMLRRLRYRGGVVDRYPSRLHYFSDWIADNTQKGLVKEVQTPSPSFAAVQQLSLYYMSKHPEAYKALKKHPEYVAEIAEHERTLTNRKYRYIPKNAVRNNKELRAVVHDGDIIAITCNKPGLDIAHVGFAKWHTDGLHLVNASSIHKKVVDEPMLLYQYLQKHPSHTGIRIVRITQKQ